MDISVLEQLSASQLRDVLPSYLSSHIADEVAARACVGRCTAVASNWSPEVMASVLQALRTVGSELRVYRANPACRELARTWCHDVVPHHALEGVEHLAQAISAGPTVVLGNHRSYVDTIVTDAVLAWEGHTQLANRLLAIAGPKVYQHLFRRVAAVSLHTLPAPQSTGLGHTAKLSSRELARQALSSLHAAHGALDEGLAPLIYPEGSRSRSGRLGPFVKGVHRYLNHPGVQVVPLVVLGSEQLMPVGDRRTHPTAITVRFGAPIAVANEGSRDALRHTRTAITALLPQGQRPLPSDPEWV